MEFSRGFATGALALILSGLPLTAQADLTPGVGAGSTGITFSLGTSIGDRFDARVQYGTFSYNTTVSSSDDSYQGQLRLQSFLLSGDYHPFKSTFALAAGLFFPHFSTLASAVPNADGSFTLDGSTFTGINSVGGTIAWNKPGPYIGVAWVPTPDRRGLAFAADLGAAFIGSPSVNISATGAGASNPLVQSAIAEETQSLESSTNFKVFPIVNVGLVYRFGGRSSDDQETQPSTPVPTPAQTPNNGNEFIPAR